MVPSLQRELQSLLLSGISNYVGKVRWLAPLQVSRSQVASYAQRSQSGVGADTADSHRRPLEQVYQVKSPIEHVLLRPDAYIGSTEPARQKAWIVQHPDSGGDGPARMAERELLYSPGLYRICDEILVNAADNWQRDPAGTTEVRVTVDPASGTVEVWNNGRGVPVAMHPVAGEYVPSLLFGRLLTSSNFDDSVKATTGGRNGFGAKLCNVYSREFSVETQCGESGLRFSQTWADNMTRTGAPQVSASSGPDFTRVTFRPDLARFGSAAAGAGLDGDLLALIGRRAYDLAATCPGVRVHFNNHPVPVTSFSQYCAMYAPPGCTLMTAANQRWQVAACASSVGDSEDAASAGGFRHVSFVNSIATPAGGRHVDLICDRLLRPLAEAIEASAASGTRRRHGSRGIGGGVSQSIKPAQVRQRLWLFCSCRVDNPSFESQAKRRLTLPAAKFDAAAALPVALGAVGGDFLGPLADVSRLGSLGRAVLEAIATRQLASAAKPAPANSSAAVTAALASGKLQHANLAVGGGGGGGGGRDCVLVLTEGDSAKALAVAGASALPGGRDRYGVLALQGKLLNAREAEPDVLAESRLVRLLCDAVGLRIGKRYESDADLATLRYRRLLVMADQDIDGTHIKGLVLNLLHCFWPELLLRRWDFARLLVTPVAKATPNRNIGGGGNNALEFYSVEELDRWRAVTPDWRRRWSVKYYKGLGAFTAAEGRAYFARLASQSVRFVRRDPGEGGEADDAALVLAFGPDTDARKAWLAGRALAGGKEPEPRLAGQPGEVAELSCSDFVHRELVQFSLADNRRSIPALADGLKPCQRKVLHACFRRRLQSRQVRVPQLAGSVAELAAYRHSDAALFGAIVGLAQDFVGSNNVNLLLPCGQFGSRLQGGKDAAAPRYIHTCLSPLTRLIFHPDDDPLLTYRVEDGEQVEPVCFAPIVPMALVNGTEGIGTGWNTRIPNHSLADVIANLRGMLSGREPADMLPAYRGHTGQIRRLGPPGQKPPRYASYGRVHEYGDTGVFEITELPVRVWSEPYGCALVGLAAEVNNYCSDSRVRFLVRLSPQQLDKAQQVGVHRYLRLVSCFTFGSMVLADGDGRIRRYQSVSDILREYFSFRLELYTKRHAHQLARLESSVRLLSNQARFAQEVSEGRLRLSDLAGRADVRQRLAEAGFEPEPDAVAANGDGSSDGEGEAAETGGCGFGYLLRMPVWSLTLERQRRLLRERDDAADRVQRLRRTEPADLWMADLAALEARAAGINGDVEVASDPAEQDGGPEKKVDGEAKKSKADDRRRREKSPRKILRHQRLSAAAVDTSVIQVPSGVARTLVPLPTTTDDDVEL